MTETRQTRGFLFADLRDYSRFTEHHGDDAATRLLVRYRSMVRDAVGRFDGAEIRTEGDSFYVVFASVGSAVHAGLAILDGARGASAESADEPIRVGIGIHAGETIDGEQGIVSSAVNI
ncbi:MAG: adenylate/guanylate cyclase domain-containing protein, partial [Candidatus Limnocylindria bacterium]